jgi:hypothetical protein
MGRLGQGMLKRLPTFSAIDVADERWVLVRNHYSTSLPTTFRGQHSDFCVECTLTREQVEALSAKPTAGDGVVASRHSVELRG